MSGQTEHTPGPWEAIKGLNESDEMRCGVVADRGERKYLVATIENGAPGDICDTEFANARLIAAAPELLEALRPFAECNEDEDGIEISVGRDDFRRARAAIARATATP